MKAFLIYILIICNLKTFSQDVQTRPFSQLFVKWNNANETLEKDSIEIKFKTKNPKITISYDEIKIIDGDTSSIYLNVTPEMSEDSLTIDRIWEEANDENGRECFVFLFYFKKENEYGLRILYDDDEQGVEYHMMALKVDTIPYKKD